MKLQKDHLHNSNSAPSAKHGIKLGLRTKIVAGVILPLMFVLGIVGIYLSGQIREIVDDLKTTDIIAQTQAAANQTEAFFDPYITTSKLMTDINVIQQSFDLVQDSAPSFNLEDSELFYDLMSELKELAGNHDSSLQAVWIAAVKNSQIIQSDGFVSDDSFIVTQRPWYKLLTKSNGKPVLTPAYIDASTGKQIVTVSMGVYDSRNNLIGATGLDITLDALSDRLSQISIGENGYVTVYDNDQNIIYHPNPSLLLKNLGELNYSSTMLTALKNLHTMDDITEYQLDGTPYYGRTIYLDGLDWQVLGCMTSEEFVREQERAGSIVTISFTICCMLLMAICFFISGTIVRPLKNLNQVAARLAEGDLDVAVSASSRDEVGDLADSISQVVARLKTYIAYIDEVSAVLDDFGRGNLVFELKQAYVGEFNRLKVAMNNIQQALSTTLFQIVNSAAQVDNGTNQIAAVSQSMAQGATEQAGSVEELAATIDDISIKINSTSENAVRANQLATDSSRLARSARDDMTEMVTAMQDISETAQNIEKVIKAIDDIAFQTNILALNAAVEAARAGSAGKGFAVVADEVRNLAGKSAESAKNTTQLIENAISAVLRGQEIAQKTNIAFVELDEKVQEVQKTIGDISTAANEQAVAVQEVTTGVAQISAVVQSNSAMAEETAASSEELRKQARLMKELTDQFQMDERFRQQDIPY